MDNFFENPWLFVTFCTLLGGLVCEIVGFATVFLAALEKDDEQGRKRRRRGWTIVLVGIALGADARSQLLRRDVAELKKQISPAALTPAPSPEEK